MSCPIVNNKYRRIITVFAVNEESEDDEGYGSIAGYDPAKHRKFRTREVSHFTPGKSSKNIVHFELKILFSFKNKTQKKENSRRGS